jgi:hypothetical protein
MHNDTLLGIFALLAIVLMALIGAYSGVDIDAGVIAGTAVTAIAAFVRGEKTDGKKPEEK